MRLQWSCRATLIAVLVAWLGLSAWPSRAQALSFGGSATGAQVFVPATGTVIRAASGQLPPSGGTVDASLLSGDIPGSATGGVVALAAGTLHSVVVGLDQTDAEASLESVNLTISGNGITADFLMARSTASCGPAVAGSSQVANLVINGQPITVTGVPNQTITLTNGTVVINEQTSSIVGSSADLTVTALHVTTRDTFTGQELADVMLAVADAQIDCQAGSGPSGLAISGGGWISVPVDAKGTFGVHAALQSDGSAKGHLVYIDHGARDLRVQSTSNLTFAPGCPAAIDGDGTSNFGPVHFTVEVQDGGEPGAGHDTFTINVTGSVVYSAEGSLAGGNIQAHRLPCP